ncbi:hypothetical protein [Lentzea indica]|uniref:hypothetical protein n=1 Tax=Lentzea indica TaxID=2604800 RepID=UPI00143CBB99|nr:hypothetical protein [Lentzea indica]
MPRATRVPHATNGVAAASAVFCQPSASPLTTPPNATGTDGSSAIRGHAAVIHQRPAKSRNATGTGQNPPNSVKFSMNSAAKSNSSCPPGNDRWNRYDDSVRYPNGTTA